MTDFATAADVAARWRPLTAAETVVATTLCRDASAVIRARFPGIDDQVTSGAVSPGVLTMVAANMVRRAMIAPPDGLSQQSQGMGPFSLSQSYANPLGNVFLTEQETVAILGYKPRGGSVRFANDTTSCGEPGYNGYIYGYA